MPVCVCVFNPFLLATISKCQLGIYARVSGGEKKTTPIGFLTFITRFSLLEKWSLKQHTIKSILLFGERPGDSTHPFVSIF